MRPSNLRVPAKQSRCAHTPLRYSAAHFHVSVQLRAESSEFRDSAGSRSVPLWYLLAQEQAFLADRTQWIGHTDVRYPSCQPSLTFREGPGRGASSPPLLTCRPFPTIESRP